MKKVKQSIADFFNHEIKAPHEPVGVTRGQLTVIVLASAITVNGSWLLVKNFDNIRDYAQQLFTQTEQAAGNQSGKSYSPAP